MTTPRDRDTHLEQWLRGASAAADGETPFCLDAETAAAWADGGLTGSALERVQLHVSDCARCQALAGSIVRASEASAFAPAAETEGRWRRWFTWVAPLTAAAAAVVAIGVWVRTPVPAAPSVRQVASPPVTETQGSP